MHFVFFNIFKFGHFLVKCRFQGCFSPLRTPDTPDTPEAPDAPAARSVAQFTEGSAASEPFRLDLPELELDLPPEPQTEELEMSEADFALEFDTLAPADAEPAALLEPGSQPQAEAEGHPVAGTEPLPELPLDLQPEPQTESQTEPQAESLPQTLPEFDLVFEAEAKPDGAA